MLENYGVTMIGVVFYLVSLTLNKSLSRGVTMQFIRATGFTALLVVADALEDYYAALAYPTPQRVLCAACGYAFRVFILYSIAVIFCRHRSRKYRTVMLAPAIINLAVSFGAFFSDKVFYFTPENEIVRGPLIAVPFVVSMIYCVFIFIEGARMKHRSDRNELLLVLIIFFFCTVTTLMEVKFRTAGILPGCSIVSIAIYYIHFMSDLYRYDPLTDACMRTHLYEETDDMYGFYGIIEMDLNDLKKLNDSQGHLAGDKALYTVAKAAQDSLPSSARLYRIGGDEFVVLYKTTEEQDLLVLANRIRKAISETPYSAALGCSMHQQNETLEAAIGRADAEMYKEKARMKGKLVVLDGSTKEPIAKQ